MSTEFWGGACCCDEWVEDRVLDKLHRMWRVYVEVLTYQYGHIRVHINRQTMNVHIHICICLSRNTRARNLEDISITSYQKMLPHPRSSFRVKAEFYNINMFEKHTIRKGENGTVTELKINRQIRPNQLNFCLSFSDKYATRGNQF